ncbi:MAG: GMC family oxidoreductase [Sneathiella sp.]|uniref:GMC family oxidoreductase n=1 Tax=Sneathiella sp. TaxID=1964365 RepID=UPI003002C83A
MTKQADRAEVLIVGAGVSGAIAAKHLAEAGVRVVCLEQGRKIESEEFYGDKPEWELMSQKRWHPNPNVRGLPTDYPIDVSESDVNPLMYSAVGGSSIIWAAHWQRFMPSDFRVRSLDGVADDWPFKYEDLEPFYDLVDIEMGVSGLAGDPAYPPMSPPPLPPHPIGAIGKRAAKGMNDLGWHWWPASQAIPSRPYRNLSQCARRGTCMQGCPENAKASTDLTHWPDALKSGAVLITGARVRQITLNAQGKANGAIYLDRDGAEQLQTADTVIMCANGVGTPRLLQLSATATHPDGLANSSGLVGRNLMMHPFAAVVGYFDEPMESWVGPAGQAIQSMQFYETDEKRGFVRGAKWNAMPTGGPLGLRSVYGGKPLEDSWGATLHRSTKKRLGRSFEWGIIAEDLPSLDNRVVLDDTLLDSDGIAAPKVIYKNSENTKRLLAYHLERAKEAMEASGATDMSTTELMRDCGWHLMGTCRMGNDPKTSVTNQWGQCHDVPNLYIFDGSLFVTSSGFNPTATIAAIALRCVAHMIENRSTAAVAL